MNYRLGTLGLIAAMVLSLPARAQDEAVAASSAGAKAGLGTNLYFSPMFDYTRVARARGTNNGYGGQFGLGRSFTKGLNLELTASYSELSGRNSSGSANITGVGVGAMVFPLTSLPDLYVPLSLQRGQVRKNPGPIPDYSTTLFDVGLGYLISLRDFGGYLPGAALRTEVRYRIDAHGRDQAGTTPGAHKAFYEGVAAIGLIVPLGTKLVVAPPAAEVAATEVVPVATGDADNDGVTDDKDQCPGTPAGAVVDEKGCELDSDGDGVVDRLDKCPNTPAGTQVDADGCPIAKCKTPGAGEPIDLNGCKAGDTVVLRGVNFELDSARLVPNAKTILDGVADALVAQPGVTAELGGHTSSEGTAAHNQKLSERRAASVKQFLVGRGIDTGRLATKGYGAGSPVADNATLEGRELNRRVELKITGGSAPAEAAPAAEVAPVAAPAADATAAPAEATPADGSTPSADTTAPSDTAATPADGSTPPADAAAPADSSAPPADAAAPADSSTPPADAATPADSSAPPADAAAPADSSAPPADGSTAPEVQNAQPAQ